jgi:exodeoxyribonuclease-3
MWIDRLLQQGYVDTFRLFNDQPEQYTYWDTMTGARERNVGWRIDYFFVSEALAGSVAGAGILQEVMGSDHCPIELDITLPDPGSVR